MDTLQMSLEDKIKYISELEPSEKMILDECNIHIFDNQLNPEAL